jgi:predicted transcriptional regulator
MVTKQFTVSLEHSYTIEAESADAALRAVLPMVRDAEGVAYSVREIAPRPIEIVDSGVGLYANLTKSAYKAQEVAELLGISRHSVYERIPCIRVGSRRLYPRAAIVDVLQNGLKSKEPTIQEAPRSRRYTAPPKSAKIPTANQSVPMVAGALDARTKQFTMKDAAVMLGISYSKVKELLDARQIYYVESYGKRILMKDSFEHFLNGGSAWQYAEMLIERGRNDPNFKNDQGIVDKVAQEMRETWGTRT